MTRILVVDDHPKMVLALSREAEQTPATVHVAFDINGARQALAATRYDLLFLDLEFRHGESGFQLLLELTGTSPELPVVLISAWDDQALIRAGREYGARGFWSKSSRTHIDKVARSVLAGETWFEHVDRPADHVGLTPRQFEVARLAIAGYPEKHIADSMCISQAMVERHIRNARERLSASTLGELGAAFVKRGLHLLPPREREE